MLGISKSQLYQAPGNVPGALTVGKRIVGGGIIALGNISGAINLDLSQGNIFTGTLTGNVTFALLNVLAAKAQSIFFILTQDATGGRTITWPTTLPVNIAPVPELSASAVSLMEAVIDGSGNLDFWRNSGSMKVYDSGLQSGKNTVGAISTYTTPVAGMYRVTCIIYPQTVSSSAWVVGSQVLATEGGAANGIGLGTATVGAAMALSSQSPFTYYVPAATLLSFSTFTSSGANTGGTYAVCFIVEKIG